jgi:hypothetical protein
VLQVELAHAIANSNKGHLFDASIAQAIGKVDFWNPTNAEHYFLRRFHELATARGIKR